MTLTSAAWDEALAGTLHVLLAFDWGEEIDLERARGLVQAQPFEFPRRRRTPASIAFRPAPLRLALPAARLEVDGFALDVQEADVTLFDFAAVSMALRVPLAMRPGEWTRLAAALAHEGPIVTAARTALEPLFARLSPAIARPRVSPLSEEFFVFQFEPGRLPAPEVLLQEHGTWLAGLLRLDDTPLSPQEQAEALRFPLSYSSRDLLLGEWAAAVLVDTDCAETLQAIEYANLQLLEYREIDQRLDDRLAETYRRIQPLARGWLPPWQNHARTLRELGELRVEANALFERTGNALKLVGDQYLARVWRGMAARFHLETWERHIQRGLDVIERAYEVVADQTATFRSELLEITIILLIVFEIGLTLLGH